MSYSLHILSMLNIKQATPDNIPTEGASSSLNNNYCEDTSKGILLDWHLSFSQILIFVSPNWLHVRSNLVNGLTYDRLIEKIYFHACNELKKMKWFSQKSNG